MQVILSRLLNTAKGEDASRARRRTTREFAKRLGGVLNAASVLRGLLKTYKLLISPLLPSACRYRPTCSEYMMDAIAKHGAFRGVWMGLKRLARCHPFHEGGYDPVR